MEVKVAPSILSADFSCLGKAVTAMKEWGADMVHIDVMDGHFVPPITIGPIVVEALRPLTDRPFDVHLMVDNPMDHVDHFISAGADSVTVHIEVLPRLGQAIRYIKDKGKKAAVSFNPETPIAALKEDVLMELDMVLLMSVHPGYGGQAFIEPVLEKIRALRKRVNELGLSTDIEVDGGIYPDNVQSVIDAGANIIVAGSAVFGSEDPARAIRLLRGSGK
jgi:ribulose-phosphate 3-epimerase